MMLDDLIMSWTRGEGRGTLEAVHDELDRRGISILGWGHFAVDACQGAVPALLPFLIASRGLSYSAASGLVLAATVASSVIQPAFGLFADRRSLPWLMPVGLLLAGLGVAAVGFTNSYAATFAAITLSGVGVAAYHPEGSRRARDVSGVRKATGMSFFSLGGNLGFAAGPVLVTVLVTTLGLHGTVGLAVVPAVAAVVVLAGIPRLRRREPARNGAGSTSEAADQWGAFSRLGLAVALRSIVYFGMMTFVPLYFVSQLGSSRTLGNSALTAMLAAGAIGTIVGGRIADRTSPRAVFLWSMLLVAPLMVAFLAAGPTLAVVLVAMIGAATIATFSVTVIIGQNLLPGHVGLASGVTLGLAIGVGGLGATGLGVLADATDIRTVIELLAVLPVLTAALAFTLPGARRKLRRRMATA
jgi:FSR family fosmidomycin resistance protein-like MFS transporter